MRRIQILFLAIIVFVTGCGRQGIRGSGSVTSETRSVSGFKEVSLNGSGQLTIDQNGTESLTITADDNLLPYLTSEVSGNKLTLGTKEHTSVSPSKDIVYKLTVKDLNTIIIAGDGSADAKGIRTDQLKVVIAGSGSLSAAGTADQQEITIAGSGDYHGGNLKSRGVTISIMGSGNADLDASDKLNATIMGSGDIKYSGAAIVTQNVLGSGSVVKR
jgi:Putative auto-transporter adhesin, head GIN domain